MSIVACLKWLAQPDAPDDERFAGVSPADRAALEVALTLGAERGEPVVVMTAGPAGADRALRTAVACGAARVVRIDLPVDAESRDVADALTDAIERLDSNGASVVVCGDYSLDRGTGSVPAYLAHRLGAAQALGLVAVETAGQSASGTTVETAAKTAGGTTVETAGQTAGASAGAIRATRRLDGGRREVLDVPMPCVLSVEGSVATLRRAGLRQMLESQSAMVHVVAATPGRHATAVVVTPYRPRARALAAPTGDQALDRLRALTDTGSTSTRGETVVLAPRDAAARIVQALHDWGYLA
jgi:electron transfer flavoprotein beta subunit